MIMRRQKVRYGNQRGIALMLTLFSLMLLSLVAFGLVAVTTSQNRAVVNFQTSQKAYYLARAGVTEAMDVIETNYRLTNYTGGTATPVKKDVTGGSYEYQIWAPPGNDTSSYKVWRITSDGISNGQHRVLTAWVDMESFAEFTYVTESDKTASGTPVYCTSADKLIGPMHTNGYFTIDGQPKFSGRVTCSNEGDPFYNAAKKTYTQGKTVTTNPAMFYHYWTNYKDDYPVGLSSEFSFSGQTPSMDLPDDITAILNKAQKTYASSIKVKFLPTGMTEVTYTESGVTKTDTIPTSNSIIRTKGTLTLLGGVVSGKVTVGADGDVYIKDSIFYTNRNVDALGVITSKSILLDTNPWVKKNIEIDACLMAPKGCFRVLNSGIGVIRGTLTLYGGVVQSYRGGVGTIDWDGNTATGYNRSYTYDPKMAYFTPPEYPSTGNVKLFCILDSAAIGK